MCCAGFRYGFALRVSGRCSLRVASNGRPRVPLPFFLWRIFLGVGFFSPAPLVPLASLAGGATSSRCASHIFSRCFCLPLSGGTCLGVAVFLAVGGACRLLAVGLVGDLLPPPWYSLVAAWAKLSALTAVAVDVKIGCWTTWVARRLGLVVFTRAESALLRRSWGFG